MDNLYDVTVADLPGYGRLAGYSGEYTLEAMAEAVLLQAPRRATWLAWSLGGMVAMQAALLAAERISALCLVCTTPRFVAGDDWPHGVAPTVLDSFADDFMADYDHALGSYIALQAGTGPGARRVARELAALVEGAPAADKDALIGGLQALKTTDLRPVIGDIVQPVQLIQGVHDRVVIPAASQYLATRFADSRLNMLDAGHIPFVSSPDSFASCLDSCSFSVRSAS